jgi:twitching motility protein PilT
MLADSLTGICSQTLLKRKQGGRVGAFEILIGTPGISNLIRQGKSFQIATLMQTGKSCGMQMLNSVLFDLVKNDIVDANEALAKAIEKENLSKLLHANGLYNSEPDTSENKIQHMITMAG